MTVTHEKLVGLWTRSLIAWPDGRRNTTTAVAWLQGKTMYIDLRQPAGRPDFSGARTLRDLSPPQVAWLATQEGFAGVLDKEGEFFVWRREIDFQPQALYSDAGRLWFEQGYMVEEGRDVAYTEHWHHRGGVTISPCWGARLSDPVTGRDGMILRVGPLFMIAVSRLMALPPHSHLSDCVARADSLAAAQDLVDCELSLGTVTPAGWVIERSSLPYREGDTVAVTIADDRHEIVVLSGPSDRRVWTVTALEGEADLETMP